jgi:hypothetical protein
MLFCTGHSSLILLFHCMNGADRTGPINTREPLEWHARTSNSKYVLLEVQTGRSIDRVLEGFASSASAPRVRTWRQVRTYRGAHAAPVRSYCFTVETELIGPAMLNGAPPKHDDMQAVAFVPEM